ncbi:hypothetical protein FXO37_00179 [Capsicum annuum]|nr:hypothetical protein FXO37_00179 [Capsicum annuum]
MLDTTQNKPTRKSKTKKRWRAAPTSSKANFWRRAGSSKTRKRKTGYQSWVPNNDVSASKDDREVSKYGGWDELDQETESKSSAQSSAETSKIPMEKGKLSSAEAKSDTPLLCNWTWQALAHYPSTARSRSYFVAPRPRDPTLCLERAGQKLAHQVQPSEMVQHSTTLTPPFGLQAHITELSMQSTFAFYFKPHAVHPTLGIKKSILSNRPRDPTLCLERAGQKLVYQAQPSGTAQHSTTLMSPFGLQAHITELDVFYSFAFYYKVQRVSIL